MNRANCPFTILFFVLTIILGFSPDAVSQEASPSPTPTPASSSTPSEEERELDDKIKILEKKILLEQKKKDLLSVYPTPSVSPLSGAVNGVDKMKMEVEIRTYMALQAIANNVACDINRKVSGNKLVLFDAADFINWQNYKLYDATFKEKLAKANAEYDCWLNNRSGCIPTGSDQRSLGYDRLKKEVAFVLGEITNNIDNLETRVPAVAAVIGNIANFNAAIGAIAPGQPNNLANASTIIAESVAIRNDANSDDQTKKSIDYLTSWLDKVPAAQRPRLLADAILEFQAGAVGVLGALTAVNTGIFSASTTLRSAIELLAYFRTDTDYLPLDVSIDRKALKSSIGHALLVGFNSAGNCNGVNAPGNIFDLSEFRPYTPETGVNAINTIVGQLIESKRKGDIEIAQYELISADVNKLVTLDKARLNAKSLSDATAKAASSLQTSIDEENKKPEDKRDKEKIKQWTEAKQKLDKEKIAHDAQGDTAEKEFNDYKAIAGELAKKLTLFYRLKISRIRQLNEETETFLDAFLAKDSTSGISPLIRYSSLETLAANFDANTFWLNINVIKSGGTNRVRKNLIRFFSGPDVSHNGAVMLHYDLYNSTGSKVSSSTGTSYLPYRRAENVTQLP